MTIATMIPRFAAADEPTLDRTNATTHRISKISPGDVHGVEAAGPAGGMKSPTIAAVVPEIDPATVPHAVVAIAVRSIWTTRSSPAKRSETRTMMTSVSPRSMTSTTRTTRRWFRSPADPAAATTETTMRPVTIVHDADAGAAGGVAVETATTPADPTPADPMPTDRIRIGPIRIGRATFAATATPATAPTPIARSMATGPAADPDATATTRIDRRVRDAMTSRLGWKRSTFLSKTTSTGNNAKAAANPPAVARVAVGGDRRGGRIGYNRRPIINSGSELPLRDDGGLCDCES